MTDTDSGHTNTNSPEESHGESHASMFGPKSRGKSRVDPSETSSQVRKSRVSERKSRAPLPRKVTFSGLSLGRPERDTERGEINKTPTAPGDPEPIGPIGERVLDDLAARRREALSRLTRAQQTTRPVDRKDQP